MAEPKTFDVSVSDGVTVIRFSEDLFELHNVASLREELIALITQEMPTKVLVNFDRVRKFGSEAIGILLDAAKRVRGNDGDVRLCSMSKLIAEVFKTCGLVPKKFQVYASSGEGISSYQ